MDEASFRETARQLATEVLEGDHESFAVLHDLVEEQGAVIDVRYDEPMTRLEGDKYELFVAVHLLAGWRKRDIDTVENDEVRRRLTANSLEMINLRRSSTSDWTHFVVFKTGHVDMEFRDGDTTVTTSTLHRAPVLLWAITATGDYVIFSCDSALRSVADLSVVEPSGVTRDDPPNDDDLELARRCKARYDVYASQALKTLRDLEAGIGVPLL